MKLQFMILSFLAGMFGGSSAFAADESNSSGSASDRKVLVVYFSASGVTKGVAGQIASVTGGDLHEIVPEKVYTAADLDWRNRNSRSSVEMNDLSFRPAIKEQKLDISGYDTIFIGYPIWWGIAPTIVNTFIESINLEGKTLVPFATSGGSPVEPSVDALRRSYPDLDWKDGRLLNRPSDKQISDWTRSLGL